VQSLGFQTNAFQPNSNSVVLTPGTGSLNFTGPAASLGLGISPAAATLTLTGVASTVTPGIVRTPATGTLALTGIAASIGIGMSPGTATLSLIGQTVSLGLGIAPGAASLTTGGVAVAPGTPLDVLLPHAAKMTFTSGVTGILTWVGEKGVITLSPAPASSSSFDLVAGGTDAALIVPEGPGSLGLSSNTLTAQAQRLLIGAVLQLSSFSNFLFGLGFNATSQAGMRWSTVQNDITIYFTTSGTGVSFNVSSYPTDTLPHRIILDINGASSALYVDDVSVGSGALGTDAMTIIGLSADGAFGDVSAPVMSWGAVGVYTAALGIPSISALDQFLQHPFTGQGVAPFLDEGIPPATATGSFTGYAPTVTLTGNITLIPNAATLTLTGIASFLNLGISPAAASLLINGVAASAGEGITPATGTLTLTGIAPTVTPGIVRTPTAGTLTFTGIAASMGLGISPAAATLTMTGVAASLGIGMTPGTGVLTLQGYAPIVGGSVTLTPAAGALTLSGVAASLGLGISPAAGALNVTGYVPGLLTVVHPVTGALIAAGTAAFLQTQVVPNAAAAQISTAAASIGLGIAPNVAALSSGGIAGTVGLGITPNTALLFAQGLQPIVSFIVPYDTPGTASLGIVGYAPSVSINLIVTPAQAGAPMGGLQLGTRHNAPPAVTVTTQGPGTPFGGLNLGSKRKS
jgi:hypothetical protein